MEMHPVHVIPVNRIEPNLYNPNEMDERTQRQLAENIRRFGFNQPLLLRPHPRKKGWFEIVDGEHRWQTARLGGAETVDAVVVEMDENLARAETLAMNRIHGEMAPADVAVLLKDITGEISYGELESFSGYTADEMKRLGSLLDFDWSELAKHDQDEEWHTLGWNLPSDAATVVQSEIERVKQAIGTEYDHLALEVMAVNSAQAVG